MLLLTTALVLVAFAGWGLLTQSGNASFDEMDGMIPFAAALLAPLLCLAAGGVWLIGRRG